MKKLLKYSSDIQIWRLLLSGSNKLIVELRDPDKKEVSFTIIDCENEQILKENLQFDEKFWIGIEDIYKDIIYFHGFTRKELPAHKGITAYDIANDKILWENSDLAFDFVNNDKLYAYKQLFETRKFFQFDYEDGNLLIEDELEDSDVKFEREKSQEREDKRGYHFTEKLFPDKEILPNVKQIIESETSDKKVLGYPEYISYENKLFFNYFYEEKPDKICNIFFAVDLHSEKVLYSVKLDENGKNYIPDSFFIKDDLLFLLHGKTDIEIFRI